MNNTPAKEKKPRRDNRRTAYIIAEYVVKEGVFRDIIKNIGPNGIFIGTQRDIDEDQDIVLRFPLFNFDHQIEVKGRVTRSGPHGFAVALGEPLDGLIREDGRLSDIVHESDR